MPLKRWQRWLISVLALFAIMAVVDLIIFSSRSGEKRYMERYVIDPLPPSLAHVKTLALFQPSLGDGYCWVAYEMKPTDFTKILQASKSVWHSGLINFMDSPHNQIELFRSVWPHDEKDLESYSCGGKSQEGIPGTVEMVVSPDHTHALFLISDL